MRAKGSKKRKALELELVMELVEAVDDGDMAEIRRLLQAGADANGDYSIADAAPELLAFPKGMVPGEGMQEVMSFTTTPLLTAVSSRKKMELMRLLLDSGADVNKGNSTGVRPLMLSSSTHVTRLLLERGAEVNACDSLGMTALMCSSNANVTRLLIRSGACVDQVDNEGMTALMYSNSEACTKVLLEAGANPNARTRRGESAIMFAKDMGQLNALLEAGADAACVADMGVTPLHIAAFMDHHRVIPFWAERYDVNVKDEQGRTPWDMAGSNDAVNAKQVLFRLGAEPSLLEDLRVGQDWGGLLQALLEEKN